MTFFSTLSFTAPWALLALFTLPVLWYLLRATPPPPQKIDFPAFQLLTELVTKKETPKKTPWWLLLLRIAILFFVILAISDPRINAVKKAETGNPILIVVDNGWTNAQNWKNVKDFLRQTAAEMQGTQNTAYLIGSVALLSSDIPEPLTAELLKRKVNGYAPLPFFPDHFKTAQWLDDAFKQDQRAFDVKWISDGLNYHGTDLLFDRLRKFGKISLFVDTQTERSAIRKTDIDRFQIIAFGQPKSTTATVQALARDGRELARKSLVLDDKTRYTELEFDLPLALKNEISMIRLENVASAGAVYLADARSRRPLIGLISDQSIEQQSLLSADFYVRKALEPFANFISNSLDELIKSDMNVLILNDVGRMRQSDTERLTQWVQNGGVLIRFAGHNLAKAAQDGSLPLLPIDLRGGDRTFGGTLSWDTPQPIGAFAASGPFSTLTIPDDVSVKKQVLARPGGTTTERTWASLEDGTPLVTGTALGDGLVMLFHVSSTPDWSDLPLSNSFVEMLRKITRLANRKIDPAAAERVAVLAPFSILDGFGEMKPPPPTLDGIDTTTLNDQQPIRVTPGFYGPADTPFAINAVNMSDKFEPLSIAGIKAEPLIGRPPALLAPFLILAAFILFVVDGFCSFKLHHPGATKTVTSTAMLVATLFVMQGFDKLLAQPLDNDISAETVEAALTTRLAYVKTGDRAVDRISALGLGSLSRQLSKRTAIEPAPPAGINIETGDLSVYPLLYWPLTADGTVISDAALSNLESFMRQGGLVIFDTRDDERAVPGVDTQERMALQKILRNINPPPIEPLSENHVLKRSFYLLDDLQGRFNSNPVWVESEATTNDAVTSVIIGGRDWAGAWARDANERPIYPMSRGGERSRELSLRGGINIVMVALTGNYKSDQVHTPILLKRLGK